MASIPTGDQTAAAADALVGIHDAGAAAQAARRLRPDLLGGEGHALVPEGIAQRLVVAHALARRVVVAVHGDQSAFLVQLDELAASCNPRGSPRVPPVLQSSSYLMSPSRKWVTGYHAQPAH